MAGFSAKIIPCIEEGVGLDFEDDEEGGGEEGVPLPPPVSIVCQNLTFSVGLKPVLCDINLVAAPGDFLAIVGPSGCGKSALLSHLAFRVEGARRVRCCGGSGGGGFGSGGRVYFNGRPGSRAMARQLCSFVLTDNRMLPYLTVRETLRVSADLKLHGLSFEAKERRIDSVIRELGLDHCSETYIGGEWKKGVSTGERRRVCIGVELVSNPSVLILDEPTSGLDSSLACELLATLKRLASTGRTVICSVQQPTSQMWGQFDDLLLLSGDGRVAYQGKAQDAKHFFAQHGFACPKDYNPADFFLSVLAAEAGGLFGRRGLDDAEYPPENAPKISTAFENAPEGRQIAKRCDLELRAAQEKDKKPGGGGSPERHAASQFKKTLGMSVGSARRWMRDVNTLRNRAFRNSSRNPVVCCIILLVMALQGIILGGIMWQLSGPIAHQHPSSFDPSALLKNPWIELYVKGIDGKQPLLDALESGVDGHGSQPLIEVLNDQASLLWVQNFVACAMRKAHLADRKNYPDFVPNDPTHGTGENATAVEPEVVWRDLSRLLQFLDHNYLKIDYRPLKAKLAKEEKDLNAYWLAAGDYVADDLLDPFLVCAGYPPFVRHKDPDNMVVRREPQLRKLITMPDTGITDAMYDLFGVGSRDFVATSTELVKRLRSCDNTACKWIDQKYTETEATANDAYDAAMAAVNVLGALFFCVANLGFASYDALLTFPQERILFNRESSNGLYSASAYFIGKNLADLPFQLLPSFVLITIFYFFIGLAPSAEQYVMYCVICLGITFAAYGFGYMVSAASPRMEIAVLVAPVTLVIWLSIAGFFLRDEQIPKWILWLSYVSFYKWGFFSLVANQFPQGGFFGILSNRVPLMMAGTPHTPLWLTTISVYLLGLLYRLLAFGALKYLNRKSL